MLISLLPEQVSAGWGVIGPSIAKALEEGTVLNPTSMSNILRSVLAEESMVWAWYASEEEFKENDPSLILLSYIMLDPVLLKKHFFIYSLSSLKPLDARRIWEEGIGTLVKYAKKEGCQDILAYTGVPQLADYLENLGWETQQRLLTLQV